MHRIDFTNKALKQIEEYITENPEYEILYSIKTQLEFILESYKNNKIPTEEEKERIIIGVNRLREFEETDPEYVDLLSNLSCA